MASDKWMVETDIDKFNDKKIVHAGVLSDGGYKAGFIFVSCFPTGAEVKVSAGKYIGDTEVYIPNFKYRIDKQKPVSLKFKTTSDSILYVNDLRSRFVKDLMAGGESVLIETKSYDSEAATASFTLRGAKESIAEVIKACKKK